MVEKNMDQLLNTEEFEGSETEETKNLDYLLEAEEDEEEKGTVTLKKSILVEDEEVKEIHYDFSSVKPIQYINLVKRLGKKRNIPVPELDQNVQLGYFALASGIPVADLKRIEDTRDFINITSKARDFLLRN